MGIISIQDKNPIFDYTTADDTILALSTPLFPIPNQVNDDKYNFDSNYDSSNEDSDSHDGSSGSDDDDGNHNSTPHIRKKNVKNSNNFKNSSQNKNKTSNSDQSVFSDNTPQINYNFTDIRHVFTLSYIVDVVFHYANFVSSSNHDCNIMIQQLRTLYNPTQVLSILIESMTYQTETFDHFENLQNFDYFNLENNYTNSHSNSQSPSQEPLSIPTKVRVFYPSIELLLEYQNQLPFSIQVPKTTHFDAPEHHALIPNYPQYITPDFVPENYPGVTIPGLWNNRDDNVTFFKF